MKNELTEGAKVESQISFDGIDSDILEVEKDTNSNESKASNYFEIDDGYGTGSGNDEKYEQHMKNDEIHDPLTSNTDIDDEMIISDLGIVVVRMREYY